MTEKPEPVSALSDAIDAPRAPLIYFDLASNQGGVEVINVTLVAALHLPKEGATNGVVTVPAVVAHLRCSREAAISLRASLDTALANKKAVDEPLN